MYKEIINYFETIFKGSDNASKYLFISSVGRGGDAGTFPPPETGKIVVEIWCYLPEVYTFGAKSEIQEIFSKKL